MTQLRSALAAFHLPTLLLAIVVGIVSSLSVNGQPIDLSTPQGRTAAVLAIAGIIVATIRTWQTNGQGVSPPLSQQGDTAATAAGQAVLAQGRVGAPESTHAAYLAGQGAGAPLETAAPVSVAPVGAFTGENPPSGA